MVCSQLPQPAPEVAATNDTFADESILASKEPPQSSSQASKDALSGGEDTEARVAAALDHDSSADDSESELEDEPEPQTASASSKRFNDAYQSSLLDQFRDGTTDPVKRLRPHLDAEAQDVLYGQDSSEGEPEEEEDLDALDDQERWDRIPYELKGKGREDAFEADWFDDG